MKNPFSLLVVSSILLLLPTIAQAQCGAGIPSGGNPLCIPPDVYHGQGSSQSQTVAPNKQPVVIRQKWEDRWGAMVVDQKVAAAGTWVGAVTKTEAMENAQKECKKAGGLICNDVYTYKNSCGAVIAMVGGGMFTRMTIRKNWLFKEE